MIQTSTGIRSLAVLFKALGDDNRLRVVALLSQGELCVCHLESALGLPQPTVSRHLGVLRSAGVVEGRRQGTWMHYQLARQINPSRSRQLKSLIGAFAKEETLKRDVERLVKAKGPQSCR